MVNLGQELWEARPAILGYIFTVMSQLTPLIYPSSDFLEYLNDDGFEFELKYYPRLFHDFDKWWKGNWNRL